MSYDKILIDEDGQEYPYSKTSDDNGYQYRISIVFDEKEGELSIINEGMDIQFDDGSMLDFNIAPGHIFKDKQDLEVVDVVRLMNFMCSEKIRHRRKYYTPEEVNDIHAAFKKYKDEKSEEE